MNHEDALSLLVSLVLNSYCKKYKNSLIGIVDNYKTIFRQQINPFVDMSPKKVCSSERSKPSVLVVFCSR